MDKEEMKQVMVMLEKIQNLNGGHIYNVRVSTPYYDADDSEDQPEDEFYTVTAELLDMKHVKTMQDIERVINSTTRLNAVFYETLKKKHKLHIY